MKKYRWEIGIALTYIAVSLGLSYFKYVNFLYTQLDLAIFTNALRQPWSNALWSMIQGHHYFGDHLAPYLILFKPFLDIFRSPLILLLLQSLIIASTIIPISAILRKVFGEQAKWRVPLMILFFANPITMGINLYEFHPEVLLLPLLFSTLYFYLKNNFRYFTVFFFLALIVREDTFLTLLPFTILALIERRPWKWVILPLTGIMYAAIAIKIISYFNPSGQSIFLQAYAWAGSSISEILIFGLTHPLAVLGKLATIYVFEFILAGLMLMMFLPLKKPAYLLFAALPYLEMALGPAQDVSIYHSHYSIPILFGLFAASIFGLEKLSASAAVKTYKNLALLIGGSALIYLNIVLGPYPIIISHLNDPIFRQSVEETKASLSNVDLEKPMLGSYQFINYSRSPEVYFLGYALQGHQQRSPAPYPLPEGLPQIVIDADDLVTAQLNVSREKYMRVEDNLKMILRKYQLTDKRSGYFIYALVEESNKSEHVWPKTDSSLTMKISYSNDEGGLIGHTYFPLLFSDQFSPLPGFENYKIEIVEIKGQTELDALGSTRRVITEEKIISEIEAGSVL